MGREGIMSIYFDSSHQDFRRSVRSFIDKKVKPFANQWENDTKIPREIWQEMGELGFLGINFAEEFGGSDADFFYSAVFLEELGRCGFGGFAAAVSVHQFMATAHIQKFGNMTLQQEYLPNAVKGLTIGALAITEPGTGSDVASITTRAIREGEFYRVNGSKVFITNGFYADFVTLAVKTDKYAGYGGISLLVVDTNSQGFQANKMDKLGWHCSDTAEITLTDVMVPASNLIGQKNMGFYYIAQCFQVERLVAGLTSIGGAEACIKETLDYMNSRKAFDRPINKFQVLRHRMTDLMTEAEATRQLTYHACWKHAQGQDAITECSMSKYHGTETMKRIVDECLQMFGGYGFMNETPISRYYRDVRVGTIVGGTSDIMKEIIAKTKIDGVVLSMPTEVRSEDKDNSENSNPSAGSNTEFSRPTSIKELIEIAPARFKKDKVEDFEATVHFDFSKDNSGSYTFVIVNQELIISEGLKGEPTCVIKTKGKTFLDIELGKSSPESAFLMRRLKVSNINQMLKFRSLFKRLT